MIKRLLYNIYLDADKRGMFPTVLRKWAGRRVDLIEQRGRKWIEKDPYRFDASEWTGTGRYPCVLGIFKELWHQHWPFIAACRELGVSYKVLDIAGPDWLQIVENANCDAFLACPSVQLSVWRQMYEERLYVISKVLHKTIFPTFEELWLWESKRRMHYWLEANQVPHPKTWVFYDLSQALDFATNVELPIVYKSDLGSAASGVIIFRDRSRLLRHITMCFRHGFTTYRRAPQDKEWRYVLLQEYLSEAREWRMLRIGDSFFGYEKVKVGDFASGSHKWRCSRPSDELLGLLKEVTDKANFRSMDLDIFVTPESKYFVSEMQTFFGMSHPDEICVIDGKAGRMSYVPETQGWRFEEGSFGENHLCNLRVQYLLDSLAVRQSVGHSDVPNQWECQ